MKCKGCNKTMSKDDDWDAKRLDLPYCSDCRTILRYALRKEKGGGREPLEN